MLKVRIVKVCSSVFFFVKGAKTNEGSLIHLNMYDWVCVYVWMCVGLYEKQVIYF